MLRWIAVWLMASGFVPLTGQATLQRGDPVAPLRLLAATEAESITLREFGRSREDRPLFVATVALGEAASRASRPRFLLVAGLHADQEAGTEVLASLPGALLERAKADPELAELLGRTALDIVPLANPDAWARQGRNRLADPRLTAVANDQDRDGYPDEDGPNDLNGDGVISWMRVPTALGEHRISPEDPRLMVKADVSKGEVATHRLLREGIDDDGDGEINEDGPGGVDLDRNWPHGFRETDAAAGPWAASEPETRALADYLLAQRSIGAVLVLGARDNLAKAPSVDSKGDRVPPDGLLAEDLPFFESFAKHYRECTGATGGGPDSPDGAFHQWAYAQYGVPGFAGRAAYLRPPETWPNLPSGKPPESDAAKQLALLDTDSPGALGAWSAFDHPTLGKVEIGGVDETTMRHHIAKMRTLPEMVDSHLKVVIEGLRRLPRLRWAESSIRPLGRGVFEVKATLVNDGQFPVMTAMGRRSRGVMPTRVTIEVSPNDLLVGDREQRRDSSLAPGDTENFRWIVRSAPGQDLLVRVWAEKAGQAELRLKTSGDLR